MDEVSGEVDCRCCCCLHRPALLEFTRCIQRAGWGLVAEGAESGRSASAWQRCMSQSCWRDARWQVRVPFALHKVAAAQSCFRYSFDEGSWHIHNAAREAAQLVNVMLQQGGQSEAGVAQGMTRSPVCHQSGRQTCNERIMERETMQGFR